MAKQTETEIKPTNSEILNQQQLQGQDRIYLVTDGLRSKYTKRAYRLAFSQFLRDGAKTADLQVLLDYKPKVIEQMVIGYIESLRDKGKARNTISLHVAAILHFFVELNDVSLNKRKVTRFIPPDESDHKDRPYRVEGIGAIVESCDKRTKVMVLLMASIGCRIGALPSLRMMDLTPVPQYNLYKIDVYATSARADRYYTYCTPECRAAIDAYLDYRRRLGETITDKTPIIRELFNVRKPYFTLALIRRHLGFL